MKPSWIDTELIAGRILHPTTDAENSVELFQAIALLNGSTRFKRTSEVETLMQLVGEHQHYVFVLVDGLGLMLRDRYPDGGFLSTALRGTLHSVFPSTTAVALTSLATAEWPAGHGLSGWWTYFPRHAQVLAPLRWSERGTDAPGETLGMHVGSEILAPPASPDFTSQTAIVFPREIRGGSYGAWAHGSSRARHYRRIESIPRLVRSVIRRAGERTHTYVYIPSVDSLCHRTGVASDAVSAEVARVDRMLGKLRDRLPENVRMIVTADHGLVDVPKQRQFTLEESDPIMEHLLCGPSGEPRSPVFHLKPGREEHFRHAFRQHSAAEFFQLHTPAELHAAGLLGKREMSAAAAENWGNLVGLSSEPVTLEYTTEEQGSVGFTGFHGGLLPDEIRVPLFVS